ncbi:MAG: VOC family protein [Phycisphaerales bacterium]|nr:VOC family protein [Phycisphaerales bacterium]
MTAPTIQGVYETVLYAPDVPAAARFYRDVLGLLPHGAPDDAAWKFRLPSGAMLLLFDAQESSEAGRSVPAHGCTGQGHIAFHVKDIEAWREALRAHGVTIEHEHTWAPGGRSLYVRDPAGNSVEFVQGEVWA